MGRPRTARVGAEVRATIVAAACIVLGSLTVLAWVALEPTPAPPLKLAEDEHDNLTISSAKFAILDTSAFEVTSFELVGRSDGGWYAVHCYGGGQPETRSDGSSTEVRCP